MNLVDGVLWVMMGLSGLLGLIRGVVKEGFSLLGWFLGFMFSSAYAHGLSQQWPLASWPSSLSWPLAWLVIFLFSFSTINAFSNFVTKTRRSKSR